MTVRPLGNVSVNATPDKAKAFEFFRVIVKVDAVFSATLVGANTSLNVAVTGAVTVSVADVAAALPPAGPVISAFTGMVFLYASAVALETLNVTVQAPLAGMIAPVRDTEPEVVVKFPAPVQLVDGAGALATSTPLGNVSLKLACVRSNPFEFFNVMVSVDLTVSPTLAGANACVTVGAAGATTSAVGQALFPAVFGAELLALVVVTLIVALFVAPVLSVTVSVTVPAAG